MIFSKFESFTTVILAKERSTGYSFYPACFCLLFFALPLIGLADRSITPEFFTNALSRQALQALKLSLVTSSITTVIAVLLGTPLAYLLARWKFRFKSWLELVLDLPIVLPPSVAGLALLIAFGRRGLILLA